MSKYVCIKDCYYNNKRYTEGEPLEDGVEPNRFFEERAFNGSRSATSTVGTESLSADEVAKLIDEAEETAGKNLEEFKELVGDHLSKFDERIKTLETQQEELVSKLNNFVETAGTQAPLENEEPKGESLKNDNPEPAAKSSAKK